MVRPLGIPIGSVRALLLLALAATAVLQLREVPHTIEPWLVAALLLAAASYFAARSNPPVAGAPPERGVFGLPAGTIRLVFLVLVGYGAWLWFRWNETQLDSAPVIWVLLAYAVGIFVRLIVRRRRPHEEAGASYFEHILALVSLLAAAGLVWLSADSSAMPANWVEPLLGSIVVHYFATR